MGATDLNPLGLGQDDVLGLNVSGRVEGGLFNQRFCLLSALVAAVTMRASFVVRAHAAWGATWSVCMKLGTYLSLLGTLHCDACMHDIPLRRQNSVCCAWAF